MANHTTGVQRRNARMYEMFDRAKSEGRGLVSDSKTKGHGVNSPAMMEAKKGFAKSKALAKAKGWPMTKHDTGSGKYKSEN